MNISRIFIHDENTSVTIIVGAHHEGEEFGSTQNYPTLVLNGVAVNWTFGFGDLSDDEEYSTMEQRLFECIQGIEEVTQYIKRHEDAQLQSGVSVHVAPVKLIADEPEDLKAPTKLWEERLERRVFTVKGPNWPDILPSFGEQDNEHGSA